MANVWHGSVRTKLTNLELETEIEFLDVHGVPRRRRPLMTARSLALTRSHRYRVLQ